MRQEDQENTARWDAQEVRHAASAPRITPEERKRRQRVNHRRQGLLWLIFVLITSAILAGVGWLLANDLCAFSKDPVTTTIEITMEDDLNSIAKKLKKEGLIEYKWFFKFFGRIRHAEDKIGVGTYELDTDMDYNALINGMRNKNATLNSNTVRVAIPEGFDVRQIVERLAAYGVCSEKDLMNAVENGDFSKYEFLPSNASGVAKLEGYLFPDTYEFFVDEDPVHAICRFLDNFSAKMDEEVMGKVSASSHSLNEILTIASLIEKETDGTDRAKIASVIYNRLNNVGETYHMLQIDASLIYGLGDAYTGKLTQADLDRDTPYNLSKYEGLPPTPIGNPGMNSILAALDPEQTGYYFYALGKDDVHHFFKTYSEHAAFVKSKDYKG